jgi:hypothetical protein
MGRVLAAVLVMAVAATLLVAAATARAGASGKESFSGILVASGTSGDRKIVSSMLVAKGVFNGSGRIVEVASRPHDPDNLDRDNLVFPQGTIHLITTSQAPQITIDQRTCALSVKIKQKSQFKGGTGQFRHATGRGTGTVVGRGVAARDPDGSCSQTMPLILEVDVVAGHGTLSY